jgi:hypothetical protein
MSNLWINFRILFWHFQWTNTNKVSVSHNLYRWHYRKIKSIIIPISFEYIHGNKPWEDWEKITNG